MWAYIFIWSCKLEVIVKKKLGIKLVVWFLTTKCQETLVNWLQIKMYDTTLERWAITLELEAFQSKFTWGSNECMKNHVFHSDQLGPKTWFVGQFRWAFLKARMWPCVPRKTWAQYMFFLLGISFKPPLA
jgi:hypothetical protein